MTIIAKALRIVLSLCGISVCVWAYIDPRFRDPEGILQGTFCLPVTVGAALMFLGWSVGRYMRFAFWSALGLVGQAVALQMINAGRLIHYQHYKAIEEDEVFLGVFIVLQACIVGLGLKSCWQDVWNWIRQRFRTWQLLGVGVVFAVSSVAPSREVGFYAGELVFATFVQAVNLGNIVLAVWALPQGTLALFQRRLDEWLGRPDVEDRETSVESRVPSVEDQEPKIQNLKSKIKNGEASGGSLRAVDRFALLAAIWVTVLAAGLSVFSYERHPHLADEVAYLYQARFFANGVLTMPSPPVPKAFEFYLMEIGEKSWYLSPPHGWPAVLALGTLIGLPWIVNPILAGINVLLAFVLIRDLYDLRAARLVAFLLAVSPWYVFLAMSFMPHTFTLTCALFGAVMLARSRRTGGKFAALLSGAAAGMASLIRPLDGLIVGGLLGIWAIGFGGRRLRLSAVAAFILGGVLVGGTVFPYNKALTGDPMVFPIMAYTDKLFGPNSNAMGFGPDRGLGWPLDPFPGHGPLDAIVNAQLNLFSVNIELFGWSTGSLLLVVLLIWSGAMQKSDYIMVFVIAAVISAYSLYWYSGGPDFGARYWYIIIVPCVALTVSAIQWLEKILVSSRGAGAEPIHVMVAVFALVVLALVNYFPWRAIDKYYHYLKMRPDVRYLQREHKFGKSIVLIRGDELPDYVSAAAYNPVDFSASVPLYAWDRSAEVRLQVVKAYPDRKVWIVDGPSVTGDGYRVVAGPLSSQMVLRERMQ